MEFNLDDPLSTFTEDQRRALETRLREVYPDNADTLDDALIAIAIAVQNGKINETFKENLDIQHAEYFEHFSQIAVTAAKLQSLLSILRPWLHVASGIWCAFDRELALLIHSAQLHVDVLPHRNGPGRPPLQWRDRLVATVYENYPLATRQKARNSHFEGTVALVLRILEPVGDADSVHDIVIACLNRSPEPYKIVKWR